MFKFGFSEDSCKEGKADDEQKLELDWFPAEEIKVTEEHITQEFNDDDEDDDDRIIIDKICGLNIKLVRPENVTMELSDDEHNNIIKAESQHSDLLPAVYEGGLKVWECSYDLGTYLLTDKIPLKNLKVLDLGCGAGVLGIIALLHGSTVHFQDYNKEVIDLITIPNVLLNLKDRKLIREKAEFYAGDWSSFTELLSKKYPNEHDKYDMILSSETIYNSENQQKLYQVFNRLLRHNGIGYIAGKTYYFGVGGGMRQFETLIREDKKFKVENVWKSDEGLQREIIKLTRQQD